MQNRTSKPISDLHVTINPDLDDIRFDFPAHTLVESDPVSGYRIYRLDTPLAPGAAMDLEFGYTSRPHGFPLNGGDTAVVYNGTFFNNFAALPQIGYDARRQLQARNDRKKYELPERPRMPPLDARAHGTNNYLSATADPVAFRTPVRPSPGPIPPA